MYSRVRGFATSVIFLFAVLCASAASADLPENLRYPKAESFDVTTDSEKPFLNTKPTEEMGTEILLTPDSFDKVLAYYEKRLGGKLGSTSSVTGLTSPKLVEGFISNDDSKAGRSVDDEFPPRDVRLVTLTKASKEHVTTFVISRTKTDKRTHIVITWIRR